MRKGSKSTQGWLKLFALSLSYNKSQYLSFQNQAAHLQTHKEKKKQSAWKGTKSTQGWLKLFALSFSYNKSQYLSFQNQAAPLQTNKEEKKQSM